MDASAVSLIAAASGYAGDSRSIFRLAFHFGLFQFIMPVLGWLSGIKFVAVFSSVDHWIAFGLLCFIGMRMIFSGVKADKNSFSKDPSRGYTLIILSVATSIDAFAVGLTLAMLHVNILYPSLIIGIVTSLLAFLSIMIGNKIQTTFGKKMEIAGGVVLILIGIRILFSHIHV